MELTIFVKGLLVGLIVCAPIGPIGLLCLKRTLTSGSICGLVSYLGAATVDGIYCSVSGFGIALVSNVLMEGRLWLKLFGSIILILAGIRIFFASPPESKEANSLQGLMSAYTSTFFLTAANPFPIAIYAAMFTTFGLHGWNGEYGLTAIAVAGVFTGSVLWAPILIGCVSRFRPSINPSRYRPANRICGFVMAGAGMGLAAIVLIRG